MSERPDLARRGLLRALAHLPLIGGSVAVLGRPTAAAEPLSEVLLDSYDAWLFYERRLLRRCRRVPLTRAELVPMTWDEPKIRFWAEQDAVRVDNAGGAYHWRDTPAPSTRAAIVLSAVGCDWRA